MMNNRFFPLTEAKGLVRQNSEFNFDKVSIKAKGIREMKSLNKQLGTKKDHFFFEQGQRIIGEYKFDPKKQIGTGYSSKVYKGISMKDNLDYAIKTVDLTNFKQTHFQMLENEIRILKKMSHPNVIKFYNVSKTPSHLYIITEFCSKGDLLNYITTKGNLPQKQSLQIFADILKGVQYLLKFGIIHRDIKPGNILYDGKNWKIADFGFSLESKEEIRTRNNVGTPLYMPLQSLQKNIYSAQSDIFSVGIVLYELIFGVTPWECRDQEQLIKRLKAVEFKIPQKFNISPSIKELLKKLCHPFKQHRMTKRQFLNLNPSDYKNTSIQNNSSKKNILQQSPKEKISSIPERQIMDKKINENLKSSQQVIPEMRQKNDLNLFASGKMKKSLQDMKKDGRPQLPKIKSVSYLTANQFQDNTNDEQSQGKNSTLIRQRSQKANKSVLLSLLNFCRFMFYLMKNAQFLELSGLNRLKIKIHLLKHALFVLQHLSDTQKNWFQLQFYQQYKQTKSYIKMYSSFQQYLAKYKKEYQSLLKKADTQLLGQINQKLLEFTEDEGHYLNEGFYQKLIAFVAPILRENNHNLALQIFNKKQITNETRYKIEGIKNFLKYYRLLEILAKEEHFFQSQQFNNIEVVKSYQQTTITVQQFMNIRKEMKYI